VKFSGQVSTVFMNTLSLISLQRKFITEQSSGEHNPLIQVAINTSGSRDSCSTATELLGAWMVVALLRSYWMYGWLWHCHGVTGSRNGCGTVMELLGEGMVMAL
jgi:hypothetical protein